MLMINRTILAEKLPAYGWLYFPWFAKMETQMLLYWGIAREVAITTLTVYLLCKFLGFILRILFSRQL